jgi:hypothetical protein
LAIAEGFGGYSAIVTPPLVLRRATIVTLAAAPLRLDSFRPTCTTWSRLAV